MDIIDALEISAELTATDAPLTEADVYRLGHDRGYSAGYQAGLETALQIINRRAVYAAPTCPECGHPLTANGCEECGCQLLV